MNLTALKCIAGLAALMLLSGCASEAKLERPYWPNPPDPTRYIYEGVIRNPDSIRQINRTKALLSGTAGQESQSGFGKPLDVAAYDGRVVVSDTANRVLHMFNLVTGETFHFGTRGDGKLSKPAGVGMDASGNVYVADVSARRVVMYDKTGHFKRLFGNDAGLVRPTDVCVSADGARIYVVDTGGVESDQHRVMVYDAAGAEVMVIGKRGGGNGEFNLPTQCDISPLDGRLFVLDAGNFRVQVFEPEGVFVRAWGKVGNQLGNLARPRGLAVDREGHVYVVDAAFANFQVFDGEGQLLLPVAGPSATDVPGGLSLPAGIAVDGKDFVYVVEQRFNKVEVLRKLNDGENPPASDKK